MLKNTKKLYSFNVNETSFGFIEVEASSEEEARRLAEVEYHMGNAVFNNTDYEITLN